MKREDLFLAIGEVEEERLAICEAVYPFGAEPREETEMYTGRNKRTSRRSRKLWLIAAIVALMLLLMGSAIAARVTMNVRDVSVRVEMKETQGSEQTGDEESNSGETQSTMVLHEGEKVDFEKTDDDFI